MNIFEDIKYKIEYQIRRIREYFFVRKCKRKYDDYKDNEFNCGSLEFIWGIKSVDDLTKGNNAHLYSMNDIDIIYDRDTKLYSLGVETAYIFKDINAECRYLKELLDLFSKFMDDNGHNKNYYINLFMKDVSTSTSAEIIEELYANFKIYVNGHCATYQKSE